jgi:hypothetical protein
MCNSGCNMNTVASPLCPDTVLWECNASYDQQAFNENCADTGTALPRYCCATEFIFEQYPGCALM